MKKVLLTIPETRKLLDSVKAYASDPDDAEHEADMILIVIGAITNNIETFKKVRNALIGHLDQFIRSE